MPDSAAAATTDLSAYEAGAPYDGHYKKALKRLQKRLEKIQVAHIVHGQRAVIVLEGWDAAGKGGIIQRLTAGWDPRSYAVWPIAAPTAQEKAQHFLQRFWTRMPAAGEIAVFDRSWYGRVLVERVEGFATAAEWGRAHDAIAAFEASLVAEGATLIKLFVHVTQATQDARFRARFAHPWKRWKLGPDDFRNRARRDDYLAAIGDMLASGPLPWTVIDGNDKRAARIAALTHIADMLEAGVDMSPPEADRAVARMVRRLR